MNLSPKSTRCPSSLSPHGNRMQSVTCPRWTDCTNGVSGQPFWAAHATIFLSSPPTPTLYSSPPHTRARRHTHTRLHSPNFSSTVSCNFGRNGKTSYEVSKLKILIPDLANISVHPRFIKCFDSVPQVLFWLCRFLPVFQMIKMAIFLTSGATVIITTFWIHLLIHSLPSKTKQLKISAVSGG